MAKPSGWYRINTVSELTGVPAPTLRAWERRYGVPVPARTDSSYRLYSNEDVELVRRMRELCQQGMAPAEAARIAVDSAPAQPLASEAAWAEDQFRQSMLEAIAALDQRALERSARHAMNIVSMSELLERIVIPVLHETGERWNRDEFTIAQEHLASEVLGGLCRDILRLSQPLAGRRALLACFPNEDHVIPLYSVGLTLTQLGFQATVLGPRVPIAELPRAIGQTQASLVALSLTIESPRQVFESMLAEIGVACAGSRWIVGGRGAIAHGESIARAGGIAAPSSLAELASALGMHKALD